MKRTDEEKVAQGIIKDLGDIHLDLTMTGYYFANLATKGDFLRLEEVYSSAKDTADSSDDKTKHYERMIRLGSD